MADGMLSLSWNSHSSTFNHMLSTVRETEKYTDVTIACGGKFYPSHKLVLSTCSDYFQKIFERTPCKHPVIVIKDIECKDIEALLSYMYAGIVNVSRCDLAQLIKAAEFLEIKGLAVPDEPPCGNKRQACTHDSSVDTNSPSLKRQKQDNDCTSNQGEAQSMTPSESTLHSSSLTRENDYVKEHTDDHKNHNTANQRQAENSHRQERREGPGSERLEQVVGEHRMDHLPQGEKNQCEVLSENFIKVEEVEFESDSEGAERGYEHESLVPDLVGEGVGDSKDHARLSAASFNHALDDQAFDAPAGPSGLQGWPNLGDSGESSSQGYSGDLPHDLPPVGLPGPPPHQMQRMVRKDTDDEDTVRRQVLGALSSCTPSNKKYQCSSCDYTTNNSTTFSRHIRTHTGEKPFHCPYCPARCTRKASLLSHIQGHMGEAPLACIFCPYVSRQRSNMTRHMKKYHMQADPNGLYHSETVPDIHQ